METWLLSAWIQAKGRGWETQIKFLHYQTPPVLDRLGLIPLGKLLMFRLKLVKF